MIKLNSTKKQKLLKLCMAFLFPFALFGGLGLAHANNAASADYVNQYEESVSVTNSSFTQGSIASSSNSLTGWSAIETYSKAKGMIVDVGSGTSTDPDEENATFAKYQQTTYMLEENPRANGSDTRILMINSKTSSSQKNILAQKGYRSNSITLNANSYYRFAVSVKTATNGDDSVNASVYVSGLKDIDNNDLKVGYENITNSVWKEYFIFIATGETSQTVTLDLYLGSANGQSSYGAVFFDEINVARLSQNAFIDSCIEKGYAFADNYQSFDTNSTRFLVSALQAEKSYIDTTEYNFDFEDEIEFDSNTLGDRWSVVSKSNGHAVIADLKTMQPADFKALTGYEYTGTDLSYNNNQALVLYTKNDSGKTDGYVGVQSKDIGIRAHEIYKVSAKIKTSEITNGSFYLKVQENDNIYSLYPEILSNNSDDKNYYALQSDKTSGYSSNTTNNFTNDFRTITFYIKGHSLYNTSVNIQLWLGDSSSNAQGCVVVDDLTLEYSDYETFSSASDKLELKSFSQAPSTISNGYFNATEDADREGVYPVKASDWTSLIESERNNISGVIYLYDQETYDDMYSGNYDWAGIYPGSPRISNTTSPNNVYMMYNRANSYQSITSSSYTLTNNSYYKLSFDYFTQNFSNLTQSNIKVEVVDEDGIVLYSKSGLKTNSTWNNAEIYFHTPQNVSHSVKVTVSLGEEDNKCGGLVYLDNFIFSSSDESGFASANLKANLDNYYLDLNEESLTGEITSSPAYNLSIENNNSSFSGDNVAVGGAVSGTNNPYIDINEDLQIDDSNYLAIKTNAPSKATLTSVYSLSLESGKYYKLSFDLATIFNEVDEDNNYEYGARVELDGFGTTNYLRTDNQLTNYCLYLKCDESTSSSLIFTLNSDSVDTLGTALLTHVEFLAVEENEYTNSKLSPSYNKSTFVLKQSADEEKETQDDTDTDSDTSKNDSNTSAANTWLLVPSIITGVAVIIGALGWALRKVKIKKIEKIKSENYDRKLAVSHEAVTVEAKKRRDEEIAKLAQAKTALEEENVAVENFHKNYLKEEHSKNNGKITKEMEKAIKEYNTKKRSINEKINILNEKIANVSTPEYLLTLERKVLAEQEEKFGENKKSK